MGEWTSSVSKHAAVGKAARERGLARRGDARGGRGARQRDRRYSVLVEGRRKQREADRGGQGIIIVPWVVFEVRNVHCDV